MTEWSPMRTSSSQTRTKLSSIIRILLQNITITFEGSSTWRAGTSSIAVNAHAEPASAGQRVRHEVEAAALVRPFGITSGARVPSTGFESARSPLGWHSSTRSPSAARVRRVHAALTGAPLVRGRPAHVMFAGSLVRFGRRVTSAGNSVVFDYRMKPSLSSSCPQNSPTSQDRPSRGCAE
jgi:hypothetical protein